MKNICKSYKPERENYSLVEFLGEMFGIGLVALAVWAWLVVLG